MITIAVLSQKGGVGKTMTSANLGASLADQGLRVLMVDFDPQADLSASWGLDEDDPRPRVEDSLGSRDIDVRNAAVKTGAATAAVATTATAAPSATVADNRVVWLLPTAYERLRQQTARLLGGDGRDLSRLLASLQEDFDIAVIDTPAGDTVFGRQAMVAADHAIIPMLPGFHELRAMSRALDVIEARSDEEQTTIALLGVLVVNADPRWRSTKEYSRHLTDMAAAEELALFDTVVPRHQPVTEHARFGLPTVWLRPASSVALAYRELGVEVLGRLGFPESPTSGEIAARA